MGWCGLIKIVQSLRSASQDAVSSWRTAEKPGDGDTASGGLGRDGAPVWRRRLPVAGSPVRDRGIVPKCELVDKAAATTACTARFVTSVPGGNAQPDAILAFS